MQRFIDIGNTNIKYCDDDQKTIIIPVTKQNIKKTITKNYKNYLLTTNIKYRNLIKKIVKKHKNIIEFNPIILNTKNVKLKNDEVGNDIWIMIEFLNQINNEDAFIISLGTYCVSVIKKQNKIVSGTINIGIERNLKTLSKDLNCDFISQMNNSYGVNTKSAIELGQFLNVYGLIEGQIKNFNLINPYIYFCGNNKNIRWIYNYWHKNSNYKCELKQDLVLKTFRQIMQKISDQNGNLS